MTVRLAMVPLDERPVCLRLPDMVAAVAGATIVCPPPALLPRVRCPGETDRLPGWLAEASEHAEAAVVSLEGLGLGGLIPSRIGNEPVERALARWSVLRALSCPVYAAALVPRTPDSDDAFEEPAYWAQHGRALHRLSAALSDGDDPDAACGEVPDAVRGDWLRRRLRQHILALAATELVADDTLATLILGIDDAGPRSLSSADADELAGWIRRLGLGSVQVHPGADETGAVLVARALSVIVGGPAPRVRVDCAAADRLNRIAPYETTPVGTTVRRQLIAAGAQVVDTGHADAVLVVHPPDYAGDWAVAPPATTDARAAAATVDLIVRHLDTAGVVAVADVAQPNGADPALVAALNGQDLLGRLAAYAAWNTAGNAAGTAAAHLVAGLAGARGGTLDESAHSTLLVHRIVEDWAWMSLERPRLRAALGTDPTRHDFLDPKHPALAELGGALDAHLAQLSVLSQWQVAPHSVRLPWNRTFEVDFEVVERR